MSSEKFQQFGTAIGSDETASNENTIPLEQCLIEQADKIEGYEIVETSPE